MEYTAPDNRVVLGYMEPKLTVLQVRENATGRVVPRTEFESKYPLIVDNWVDFHSFGGQSFIDQIPRMTGIEGFVIELHDGTMVKTKTEWYLAQHRAKDSINSPRRLLEVVLEEAGDDLKALLHNDPLAVKQIEEMEKTVALLYSQVAGAAETFYNGNKDLDRKSYAIKGQAELARMHFGLAMTMYLGKEVNYKEFIAKHYKELGIRDEEPVTEE
jgi:T4 RnlA family RNA ligase